MHRTMFTLATTRPLRALPTPIYLATPLRTINDQSAHPSTAGRVVSVAEIIVVKPTRAVHSVATIGGVVAALCMKLRVTGVDGWGSRMLEAWWRMELCKSALSVFPSSFY